MKSEYQTDDNGSRTMFRSDLQRVTRTKHQQPHVKYRKPYPHPPALLVAVSIGVPVSKADIIQISHPEPSVVAEKMTDKITAHHQEKRSYLEKTYHWKVRCGFIPPYVVFKSIPLPHAGTHPMHTQHHTLRSGSQQPLSLIVGINIKYVRTKPSATV